MLYYRATCDAYDYFSKRGVVIGELLTEKERYKLVPYIRDSVFDKVNISKSLTFKMFGVRKQITDEMYNDLFRKCGVE